MITIDWVYGVGHTPVCQIVLQTAVRMLATASLPACINSAGIGFNYNLHFFTKNWEVILFDVHRIIQYCCIYFGLAVVSLGAVICPSVDNLCFFREAVS